ncbi:MAG TPA: hypothetical protein PK916_08395 [Bacteroidota bacterium]|nr:hypothetical protein [Bacteroidota bacterium]
MEATELRAWLQFAFIAVGGVLGLAAYFQNMRQRRIENALKMISWFKDALREGDLAAWEATFRGSHAWTSKEYLDLEFYYSEGASDGGALARISDNLEVLCAELLRKTVEPRFIWFELGQVLGTIKDWTSHVASHRSPSKTLLQDSFPNIDGVFRKYGRKFETWAVRTITYVE